MNILFRKLLNNSSETINLFLVSHQLAQEINGIKKKKKSMGYSGLCKLYMFLYAFLSSRGLQN